LRIIRKYLFSVSYRLFRFLVKHLVFIYQKISNRDKDLESIVEFGDKNLTWINNNLGSLAFNFTIPKGLETELFDLKFKSPLVAASFKSDENLLDIWMKLGLGGSTYKTVMKSERSGNPRPRLQQIRLEREQCLVNALGLPGSGIDLFTKELLASPLWTFNRPMGISIGGENLDEYISNFNDIEKVIKGNVPDIYYYELNISCPNTDTGSCIGDDLDVLEKLVEHVRVNCSATVSLKISPDWSNDRLRKIGAIIKKKDKMFVNAGNTQFRTV
ncbi:uncharacterized protein METZ01_LOCUS182483, partial [marine metagenome]